MRVANRPQTRYGRCRHPERRERDAERPNQHRPISSSGGGEEAARGRAEWDRSPRDQAISGVDPAVLVLRDRHLAQAYRVHVGDPDRNAHDEEGSNEHGDGGRRVAGGRDRRGRCSVPQEKGDEKDATVPKSTSGSGAEPSAEEGAHPTTGEDEPDQARAHTEIAGRVEKEPEDEDLVE